MKYLVLCTLFCFSVASYQILFDPELDEYWENYKKVFGKRYGANEDVKRRLIWEERVANIVRHNLNADLGLHTYRQGLNKFTDMEHSEFVRNYHGFIPPRDLSSIKREWAALPNGTPLPDTVDWRDKGYVTPVKDQRNCGSCWAFSATGALEGQFKKKNGTLVSLSEQQLLDCSARYGNKGCDGGTALASFEYISHSEGIDTEASYPYTSQAGPACLFNNKTVGATCWNARILPGYNEGYLKEAVATIGPIAVSIDGSHESFMMYDGGIYNETECDRNNLNHAVLVVGYGTEDKKDYWLVKASYGTDWGLSGYIKMSRNYDNQCGIATFGLYPLV